MHKVDVYCPSPDEIPLHILKYYSEGILVPDEVSYYSKPIKKVSIRIYKSRFYRSSTPNDTIFKINNCYVKLKFEHETIKIGLHLLPVLRFKQASLPSLSIKIICTYGKKIPIYLPLKMEERLIQLFNRGRPGKEFSCIQLVDYLNGLYTTGKLYLNNYVHLPFHEMQVGDAVHLVGSHMAIYLGHSLYLWMRGIHGLHVSNLETMSKLYRPESIEVLRKKVCQM
jgi:hypothetical protein